MKLTEYKGYAIDVSEHDGSFTINGVNGFYTSMQGAKTKIDTVLKAEVKGIFPIIAISSQLHKGKITSMNTEQAECWFTIDGGRRVKERLIDYSGKPKFFADNDENNKLVIRALEISEALGNLQKEQRLLEKSLTEPIKIPEKD